MVMVIRNGSWTGVKASGNSYRLNRSNTFPFGEFMTVDFLEGDVREVLKTLPNDHFDCAVTSPPYWGLRDYGVPGQIGLEPTLKEYIENMVNICGEIRRVMKPTGCFFLNVGDFSYCSIGHKKSGSGYGTTGLAGGIAQHHHPLRRENNAKLEGLKHKDLCMVPNRLAIALQDDGWYVRSEIIWHKPSCMPESVTDRPTQAHEKIWLLTKNSRYYYDAQAVAQYLSSKPHAPSNKKLDESRNDRNSMNKIWGLQGYANLRNVWTINSKGYEGAHFATFPPALVERCIRAGSSAHGCCSICGSPYERVIEKGESLKEWKELCGADSHGGYNGVAQKDYAGHGVQDASAVKARILAGMVEKRTIGWRQTCKCVSGGVTPSRVLDPFGGSGTTGLGGRCFRT